MNMIVGARIDKKLYDKIKKDTRSQSEIVRAALDLYFSNCTKKTNVNTSLTEVKHNKKNREGEDIHSKIDAVLSRFNLI
jgi:hypothetical protein